MKFTSKHACLGLAEIDRTIVEALRYAALPNGSVSVNTAGISLSRSLRIHVPIWAGLLITVFVREVLGKSLYFSTEKHVS